MFNHYDPVINRKRKGTGDDPFIDISESLTVNSKGVVHLSELPDYISKVDVVGETIIWYEITEGSPDVNEYLVNYRAKTVTFNLTHVNKQLQFNYKGKGLTYIPTSSIYTKEENGEVIETLKDLTSTTQKVRDETSLIKGQFEAAETERVGNETTRIGAENTRKNSELTRIENENLRISNEDSRVSDENTRDLNETSRVNSENVRTSNEDARVSAENIRLQSETNRVNSENERINSEDTRAFNESVREQQEDERQTNTGIAVSRVDAVVDETRYVENFNINNTYKKNNIVNLNGNSYIAKQETVGNIPTDEVTDQYWALLSRKGADGTGTVHVHRDTFVATEGQTIFTLSHNYDQFQNRTEVVVGGVPQRTPENYEESSSNTIILNNGVASGTIVEVRYFSEAVPMQSDIQTTVDSHTAEINKFNDQSIYTENFIATEGQSVFTLQTQYDQLQDKVEVYVDGVPQDSGDNFTESANNQITLSEGVPVGTEVKVRYFGRRLPIVTDVEATLNTHSGELNNHTSELQNVNTQLAENTKELKKQFMKPQYVEFFGSFNKYGLGVPAGIANYTGGNYVLTVSGNAGDSFVTVQSGNIADAGATTKWACVIENNDGIFDINQVVGTDGVSKVNLFSPLKTSVINKRLGNLHDAALGQHYTELGYFAFAQHIFFTNPRHAERDSYIARMKPDDTSGKWVSNAYNIYNQAGNMKDTDNTFLKIGSKHYLLSAANNTSYTEWEQKLDGEKGNLEIYVGVNYGTVLAEFFKDGVLSESVVISKPVNRLTFDYEGVQLGKIKFTLQGASGLFASGNQAVYIGLTTWWKNEKFQEGSLIKANDKVVYIGDSWGTYHNKATTRELTRLMQSYGGNPTILDYSKAGHSSEYARAWFEEYVIANKPDKVVIEYFTNDFNSIRSGTDLGVFIKPDGTSQNMSISSLTEYVDNINYMIKKAIENGIQPIIIMPASTNSETQAQTFADYSTQIWLGKSIVVENPSFKNANIEKVLTSLIESVGTSSVGSNLIKLLSKETNSSARKGVMSDSNVNLTGGDIHGFYNNGARKSGVRHDGTLDSPFVQLQPQSSNIGATSNSRGVIYVKDDPSLDDSAYIILQKADGTYARFKLSGVFE
jgi:hypothetical protein